MQKYETKFTKWVDGLKEDFYNDGGKLNLSIIDRALDLWNNFFKQWSFDQATTWESKDDLTAILKEQSDQL